MVYMTINDYVPNTDDYVKDEVREDFNKKTIFFMGTCPLSFAPPPLNLQSL